MAVQALKLSGKDYVVIPTKEFRRLSDELARFQAEMRSDIAVATRRLKGRDDATSSVLVAALQGLARRPGQSISGCGTWTHILVTVIRNAWGSVNPKAGETQMRPAATWSKRRRRIFITSESCIAYPSPC